MARSKDGRGQEGEGGLLERQRVLIHASSLNRSDIIKKVVSAENNPQQRSSTAVVPAGTAGISSAPGSRQGEDSGVDHKVLDHVDGEGLTALHHAVKKSSLDALRVLLRLGVDVTARGGAQSPFPNLTALQVALSGKCEGNPEKIKQIFLTEAVQAIAGGDAARLREFLEAGLEASSEYGTEGGDGEGGSMSLADWAEQFGQSDMLAALSSAPPANDGANTLRRRNEDVNADRNEGEEEEVMAPSSMRAGEGGDGRKGGRAGLREGSGGDFPDDVGMFVEELRAAIVGLTAESDELEAELSQRGTLGIIKRARSTRQDLILATSEVETANALCDKWRAEENVAADENARLQAEVIEAQLAVQRYRAGSVDHLEDRVRPTAEGEEAPAASPKGKEDAPSQIPPPPPPLKQEEGNPDVFEAAGGGGESEPDGGVPGTAAGCRKTEEAEALASQLQIIAMHLEDELRLMRSLVNGEGAVGVVRRIRALREEIDAAEEEARQTYAISRYLEARVIVLSERGDELFSQLDTLHGYLRAPRREEEDVGADGATARSRSAANKEDIDADDAAAAAAAAALQHGYYHHGSVPDASESEEEEEEEEEEDDASLPRRHGTADDGRGEAGGGGDDAPGGENSGVQESRLRAARVVSGDARATAAGATATAATATANSVQARDLGGREAGGQGESGAGGAEGGDIVGGDNGGSVGPEAPHELPEAASEREISVPTTAAAAAAAAAAGDDRPAAEEDEEKKEGGAASTGVLFEAEGSDAGGGGGGGQREGRARALLSAPGVDAATGVRGWKRRNAGGDVGGADGITGSSGGGGGGGTSAKKVSVVQDVLSVLFGWEVSTAAERKAARGGGGDLGGTGSGGAPGGGAGVMFA